MNQVHPLRWACVGVSVLGVLGGLALRTGTADTPPDAGEPMPGGSGGGTGDTSALPGGADPASSGGSDARNAGGERGRPRSGGVDLRPRWREGETLRYVLNLDTRTFELEPEGKRPKADAEPLTRMDQRLTLVISPRSVGESESTIDLTIEGVRVKFAGDAGEGEFDSARPGSTSAPGGTPGAGGEPRFDEQLRAAFAPMAGKTMTLTVDRSGSITRVSGGDIVDLGGLAGLLGPKAGVPGGAPVGQGGLGGLGGLTGAGGGGGDWLITGGPTPGGLVSVGQTWTHRDGVAGTPAGGLSLNTVHTLRSHSGGVATVAFSGSVEPSSQSPETASPGDVLNPLLGLLKGVSHQGSYRFDTERGRLVSMDSTLTTDTAALADGVLPGMRSQTKMTVELRR